MSQLLELPDALYDALVKAAEVQGSTPQEWIAAHLAPDQEGKPSAPKTLADLFAGRVGLIRSGGRERLSEECREKFTDALVRKRAEGHL